MPASKTLRQALFAIAFAGISSTASAALVSSYVTASGQGGGSCNVSTGCDAVAVDRSVIAAIDAVGDGLDDSTGFYSLGANGFLEFNISPYTFGTPVFTIETTFGSPNRGFPESADFIFFTGDVESARVGINNQNNVIDTYGGALVSGTWSAGTGDQGGSWEINLLSSDFTKLRIEDTTLLKFSSSYSLSTKPKTDGFDIDYLSFNVNKVPEPGSLALLGVGLLGLVGASRRRKA